MYRIYVTSLEGALSTGILVSSESEAKDLCEIFNTLEQDLDREYIYREVN